MREDEFESRSTHNDSPKDFQGRQEPRRKSRSSLEGEHRDLSDDVGGVVGDVEVVELVAVHAQIFLHSRNVGVGDVTLVKKLREEIGREGR